MPAKLTIREQYYEYRKTACEWCAKGYLNGSRANHQIQGLLVDCTAMTFYEWAAWRIERLEAALREIAFYVPVVTVYPGTDTRVVNVDEVFKLRRIAADGFAAPKRE